MGSIAYSTEREGIIMDLPLILKQHEMWRVGKGTGARANFSGDYLSLVDFREADLSWASFQYADLRSANFGGARAVAANFQYANLGRACLNGADLTDADFTGAKLGGANLTEADLTDTGIILYHMGKHNAIYNKGMLSIVCKSHKISDWLDDIHEIGYSQNYSKKDIEAHLKIIKTIQEIAE